MAPTIKTSGEKKTIQCYHANVGACNGCDLEVFNLLNACLQKKKHLDIKLVRTVKGADILLASGSLSRSTQKKLKELKESISGSKAIIAVGTCAAYGGVQAAKPNPGGYKGVGAALGIKTLNIPGCPPNPVNFVGTVVNYLLLGKLPALDDLGRPLFAYGKTIHDQCPRRSHFENDEFVEEFGSEEAALGYCLYKVGCRGPETYNNCPIVKFNDGTSWPIEAGHPCIGCSEPDFWDTMSPFYEEM